MVLQKHFVLVGVFFKKAFKGMLLKLSPRAVKPVALSLPIL